jgi:hypothetical protein
VQVGDQIVAVGCLPFESQGVDYCPVAIDVFEFYIVEQPASSADQHQQTPAGMMIFFVDFQMLGKIGNAVGKKTDLHFRGSRICLMQFKFFNQFLFIFGCESHFLFASS